MKKIITTILISLAVLTIFAAGHTVTITSTNVSCFGGSNGTATASVSGGVGPFSYSWSSGATVATNLNLAAGSYTCTVTDNNDLSTATSTVSITEPAASITATTSHTDAYCGVSNGTATVSANGGTGPYTYSWSNGAGGMTITALAAGSYSVTVTDSNGCTRTDVVAVNNLSPPPLIVSATPITCNGGTNGTATVTVNGGSTPYTYAWSHSFTASVATGLVAGTYAITVADANGCMTVSSVVITEPPAIVATTTSTNATCGQSNGTATASVSGGVGGYVYLWSPPTQTGTTATGLVTGSYSLTVTDANGCTGFTSVNISVSAGTTIAITKTDATCGQSNGTATVSGSGGTPPFSFLWSTAANSATLPNLPVGSYSVTVTDGNGCTATSIATISDTGSPNVVITTKNASCQEIPDGKASALASGGVAPYTYSWNDGSANDTIFNLAKGNYVVTVTDGTGCKAVKLASVGVPGGGIHFNIRQLQYNNCGLCTAKAKVYDLDGGISPYTYYWSSGLTTDSIYNMCKGSYSLTVTDNAGCTASGNIYIGGYNGNVLRGRVYNDKNNNCVYDAGEEPLKNAVVFGYNVTMTDSNGVYTIYNIPTGYYNVSLSSLSTKWIKYNCPSAGNYSVNITGTCDTISNKDFALSVPSNVQDLRTTLYTGTARPGFEQWNQVCYYNDGTKTMNGIVRVTHDSDQVFKSAFPVQASYTYPVLEWNFTNLAPGASSCISFTMETPATKPIGTKLITKAEVFPIIGDTAQENNTVIDTRNVQGSYDPNLKEVQPNGNISPTDTVLKYTIHFQNTGNDTAFNITVRDTLPVYLNPATIKIGASSHFCRTELFNNVLVFTFPNILLVDSIRNEPKSHGWVNFTIHSKPGIPVNTVIDNEADIYFDFNEPITTNKASNKIIVVGVSAIEDSSNDFSIYPNPAAGKIYLLYKSTIAVQKVLNMEMFNILGSKVRSQQNIRSGVNEISLEGLSRGLYLLQIKDVESKVVDVERVVVE
ncbi:MAG: T9SS type A sorting domain-containing protein [Bacteroidetes bacterium]|nr:T9SS type A sorting domain-containing protein [Bacteroidota bacterium]